MRRRHDSMFICGMVLVVLLAGAVSAAAATHDNKVEWDGVFSDQGPLYMEPTEPTATTPVKIRLRVFEGDITSANIKYWDTADQAFHWVAMRWEANDPTRIFDMWVGIVPASPSAKFYRFQINDGSATAWLNAVGVSASEAMSGDFWLVPGFHTPTWAKNAIYYQIFPDRFYNGDPSNDLPFKSSRRVLPDSAGKCPIGSYLYKSLCAYQHTAWSELPESEADFFGGDLPGITAKIGPYLTGTLGVTALYLNPIFQSPSNHKYDTQDYTRVDPHFGTNASLQELIRAAHTAGMAVLLDGVFNHTSTLHPWFDQQHLYAGNGAAETRNSPWFDHYVFLHWPDIYCDWARVRSMPKLNYGSSGLRDAIYRRTDSIMQTYLRSPYEADGWRYDVAQDVESITSAPSEGDCSGPDNHAIWQEVRPFVKGTNPEALMLGEYWGNANAWTNGKEWDAVMNYNGFGQPISKWINCQNAMGDEAGQCLTVSAFDQWLRGTLADYPRPTQLAQMNSLSTHDTPRFLWRAGGDEWKMKLAIIFQMTYVGAPSIYYGDEIGLTGGKDPDNRRTFNWDTAQWNRTLLNLYETLIEVRKHVSALRVGSFKTLLVDDTARLYSYGRWDSQGWAIIVLNNDTVGHPASVPAYQLSIPDGTVMTDKLTGASYRPDHGVISIPASALLGHYGVVLVAARNN